MHNCKLNNTGSQCSNFEGTYSSLVDTYCQRHRFVLFKNGFNAVLWCCLQTMIKRLKVSLKKAVRVNETSVSPYLSISLPSATVVAERLCFHKRLSVHRGEVYTPWADTSFPRQTPPSHQADTPCGQTPPPTTKQPLQRTVRIILECILVQFVLSLLTTHFRPWPGVHKSIVTIRETWRPLIFLYWPKTDIYSSWVWSVLAFVFN